MDLFEQLARILAFVDAAARAGENDLRPDWIDNNRKHIGVVDDAPFDVVPAFAAITGLPRQMPGTGVNHIGIRWINRQRLHLVNFLAPRRADQRPGDAGIPAPEDPFQGSGIEHGGIGGRLRKSANRLAAQPLDLSPAPPPVAALPQPAVLVVQPPRGHINSGWIGLIHKNVVQDQVVKQAQLRKPMPG